MDHSPPGSSVSGILQARILEWAAIPFSWNPIAAATAKSLQLCPTLCNPIDGSPSGSPVPGILQARTLEWVAISFSNAWKWKVKVKSLSCVRTLRDPMDCSLPGAYVHGIFQARILEWDAIAFSGNPIMKILLSPIRQWENRGSEVLGNLLKLTHLLISTAGFQLHLSRMTNTLIVCSEVLHGGKALNICLRLLFITY